MSQASSGSARADQVPTEGSVASASEHSALRADIRRLSTLLGRTLARQHGDDMLELVEKVRHLSRADRDDERIRDLLASLDPGTAAILGRAFATYFHLANLAEQLHRAQECVARRGDGRGPLHVLTDRLAEHADPDELATALSRLELKPVFTAHPTEAQRQSVLGKLRSIASILGDDLPDDVAEDVGRDRDERPVVGGRGAAEETRDRDGPLARIAESGAQHSASFRLV